MLNTKMVKVRYSENKNSTGFNLKTHWKKGLYYKMILFVLE
jgi:hypothetical protein